MKQILNSVLLLSSLAIASSASAATWSGNGHTYTLVNHGSEISWSDAQAAAINAGGYLATITSQAELDFVYQNVASNDADWTYKWGHSFGPWLGGSDATTEGVWEWVTGETWNNALAASTWATNEPNNGGTSGNPENYLHFFARGIDGTAANWNDSGAQNSAIISYIIETPAGPSSVPVPAAAFLFAPALLGFMGLRRKAKKA